LKVSNEFLLYSDPSKANDTGIPDKATATQQTRLPQDSLAFVTEVQLDLAADRQSLEELLDKFNELNPIRVVSDPGTEIIPIPEGAIPLGNVTTYRLFDNGLGEAIFELMVAVKPGEIVGVATDTVFGDDKLGTFASWNVVGKTPDGRIVIEVATQTSHASDKRLREIGYEEIRPESFGPDIIRFAIDPQNPRFDGGELMWPIRYDRSGDDIGWNPQLSSAVVGDKVRNALLRIGFPSSAPASSE